MFYLIYDSQSPDAIVYELKQGLNTIGRQIDNHIVIPRDSISRYHAEIEIYDEFNIVIRDRKSLNHTQVNKVKIQESRLQIGDEVTLGVVDLLFTNSRQQSKIVIKQLQAGPSALLLEKPENDSIQRLKILLEISKQLCSLQKLEQLLNKILELLFKVMDIDRAVILLVNEQTRQLELKAIKLREGVEDEGVFYSTKITNLVKDTGNAILTSDARTDQRFNDSHSILVDSIQASMCVPLKTSQEVKGVLYVDNLSLLGVYCDEDLEFLYGLANQAVAALVLVEQLDRRDQKVKEQLVELQIEIDQHKKDEDVSNVVSSDFFRNLENRATKLRQLLENN